LSQQSKYTVPIIRVNPVHGFVTDDLGFEIKKTRRGTPVQKTLKIRRMLKVGDLVEVSAVKQKEKPNG
jgi:hypothetical protein